MGIDTKRISVEFLRERKEIMYAQGALGTPYGFIEGMDAGKDNWIPTIVQKGTAGMQSEESGYREVNLRVVKRPLDRSLRSYESVYEMESEQDDKKWKIAWRKEDGDAIPTISFFIEGNDGVMTESEVDAESLAGVVSVYEQVFSATSVYRAIGGVELPQELDCQGKRYYIKRKFERNIEASLVQFEDVGNEADIKPLKITARCKDGKLDFEDGKQDIQITGEDKRPEGGEYRFRYKKGDTEIEIGDGIDIRTNGIGLHLEDGTIPEDYPEGERQQIIQTIGVLRKVGEQLEEVKRKYSPQGLEEVGIAFQIDDLQAYGIDPAKFTDISFHLADLASDAQHKLTVLIHKLDYALVPVEEKDIDKLKTAYGADVSRMEIGELPWFMAGDKRAIYAYNVGGLRNLGGQTKLENNRIVFIVCGESIQSNATALESYRSAGMEIDLQYDFVFMDEFKILAAAQVLGEVLGKPGAELSHYMWQGVRDHELFHNCDVHTPSELGELVLFEAAANMGAFSNSEDPRVKFWTDYAQMDFAKSITLENGIKEMIKRTGGESLASFAGKYMALDIFSVIATGDRLFSNEENILDQQKYFCQQLRKIANLTAEDGKRVCGEFKKLVENYQTTPNMRDWKYSDFNPILDIRKLVTEAIEEKSRDEQPVE